ncbi:hypothetical protein Dimus_027086, partial [Dionaea muscipula]
MAEMKLPQPLLAHACLLLAGGRAHCSTTTAASMKEMTLAMGICPQPVLATRWRGCPQLVLAARWPHGARQGCSCSLLAWRLPLLATAPLLAYEV